MTSPSHINISIGQSISISLTFTHTCNNLSLILCSEEKRWKNREYVSLPRQLFFFTMAQQPPPPSGPRSPHYPGFMITLRHTTLGRTPLDDWSARHRDLYLTIHNIHNRQTSMPRAGFEPTIPEVERPQIHGLDRAATGISLARQILTEVLNETFTSKARPFPGSNLEGADSKQAPYMEP